MADRDYYELLEVPRNASPSQIKSAYRRLAKKYHPDRNRNDKSAEARFKEIHEAYEVLNDPAKRRAYDQYGHAGVRTGGAAGAGGWRPGPGGQRVHTWGGPHGGGRGFGAGEGADIPIEDIEDLFSIFGGGRQARAAGPEAGPYEDFFSRIGRRGRGRRAAAEPPPPPAEGVGDIKHEVSLPFLQAVNGTQLEMRMTRDGVEENVTVKIPPGVRDGQRIRIRGKGQPRGDGRNGDLYIIPRVQPHPYFRRVDDDIYLDLPLTLAEAALGAKVEIPTLEGRTVLTVPAGTSSGARLRLKNLGVKPPGDKPRGHQYAVVRIVPPKVLTPDQRRLLEELHQTGENSPRSEIGW